MTFGNGFDMRHNSLNAIRLLLAVLVIVSHSWPLGGYGADPGWGDLDLGDWALAGFFVISGYLITMSRERSRSLPDYLWRRFLRIYPGFLVCLLVTGLVIAPLASKFLGAGDYTLGSGLSFVLGNLGLYITQFGVPGTLESVPFPNSWNGPLWSLAYEFACYLGIGALVSVVPAKARNAAIVTVFVGCTLVFAVQAFGVVELPEKLARLAKLGAPFFAGAMLYVFRDRVLISKLGGVACAAMLVAMMATGTAGVLAGLPLAYLLMGLGVWLPLQRVGANSDISYGMYIYAFPIQQCLVLLFGPTGIPAWTFVALAIMLTMPLAWASYRFVERPALALKNVTARKTAPVAR